MRQKWKQIQWGPLAGRTALVLLGAAIASFGIYNIHRRTGVTEGGVLGLLLLAEHWLGIPSSLCSLLLDLACYALALRSLGWSFLRWSAVATVGMSAFFRLWESFPPMLPDLSAYPLAAALLGGMFVGIGVGIIVRQGGSSGGDDALALTISRVTHLRLSRSYLFTDLVVLGLSLSYIPAGRIFFSVVTVTISSFLIDCIQNWEPHKPKAPQKIQEEHGKVENRRESMKSES